MSSTITALTSGGGLAMAGDTSGQLELKTNNGTTAVTITTAQAVGIGTSSPSGQLSVKGANGIYAERSNDTDSMIVKYDGITQYANATGTNNYNTWTFNQSNNTATVERMRIDSSGNVNIGTTGINSNFRLNLTSPAGNGGIVFQPATDGSAVPVIRMLNAGLSAAVAEIGTASGTALYFNTAGSERMRIASGGEVLVGSSSNYGSSALYVTGTAQGNKVYAKQSAAGGWVFQSDAYVNGGTYYHMQFVVNGSAINGITSSATTITYATSSDYRLKEDVKPMVGALNRVSKLKPVTYKWKLDGSDGEGFIAHELQEVCPLAVTGEKDQVNEDGSIKPQGMDTSHLVATLTAAIQELNAKVTALEAQLGAKA